MSRSTMNRRDFTRLFAAGGSAALLSHPRSRGFEAPALKTSSLKPGSVDWAAVRAQFLMPPDITVMNAANLIPDDFRRCVPDTKLLPELRIKRR